jgi:hypothetical protein
LYKSRTLKNIQQLRTVLFSFAKIFIWVQLKIRELRIVVSCFRLPGILLSGFLYFCVLLNTFSSQTTVYISLSHVVDICFFVILYEYRFYVSFYPHICIYILCICLSSMCYISLQSDMQTIILYHSYIIPFLHLSS